MVFGTVFTSGQLLEGFPTDPFSATLASQLGITRLRMHVLFS